MPQSVCQDRPNVAEPWDSPQLVHTLALAQTDTPRQTQHDLPMGPSQTMPAPATATASLPKTPGTYSVQKRRSCTRPFLQSQERLLFAQLIETNTKR